MEITINPKYKNLEDFIYSIPEVFDQDNFGIIMHQGRNIVKNIDNKFVIKKFVRITWANRIIYSFFRKTKAQRCFEITQQLKSRGFDAPEEIAYIEIKKNGILKNCYYIYHFSDYIPLNQIINNIDKTKNQYLIKEFAHYITQLHRNGIIHYDLNITNILYNNDPNNIKYQLIDVNRIKFRKYTTYKDAYIRNLVRMDHKNELYNEFIAYYEQIMGFEPNYILNKCASFQIKREALVKSRHLLKNIILLRFLKTRKAPKVQCNISHDTNMVK